MPKIPFWTEPRKVKDFTPERDEGWYHLTPQEQRLSDQLSRIEQSIDENGQYGAIGLNTARVVGLVVLVAIPYQIVSAVVKIATWWKNL